MFPSTDGERRRRAECQDRVRFIRPILDVMRMGLRQIGLPFGVEAHGHRDGAGGHWFQMNGEALFRPAVDAFGK